MDQGLFDEANQMGIFSLDSSSLGVDYSAALDKVHKEIAKKKARGQIDSYQREKGSKEEEGDNDAFEEDNEDLYN